MLVGRHRLRSKLSANAVAFFQQHHLFALFGGGISGNRSAKARAAHDNVEVLRFGIIFCFTSECFHGFLASFCAVLQQKVVTSPNKRPPDKTEKNIHKVISNDEINNT